MNVGFQSIQNFKNTYRIVPNKWDREIAVTVEYFRCRLRDLVLSPIFRTQCTTEILFTSK